MKPELFNPHKIIALRLAGLCQSDLSWLMDQVGESDREKINRALQDVREMGVNKDLLRDSFSQILKAVEHHELTEEKISDQINPEQLKVKLLTTNEFDSALIFQSLNPDFRKQTFGGGSHKIKIALASNRDPDCVPSDQVKQTVMEFLMATKTESANR
ncbi:hypothetical protein [Hahella sp. CCB-MM4]|uniref:hypothetical protein n=1 Tax=Hahella sp. (strain CCB-MM4) TaxID=1926491 RepID=UPI00113FF738|nr:hypothetical protein [Hahella sp. CCB-MM4]